MVETMLSQRDIDARITFHENDQIMEVSFRDLSLDSSADVNAFYDRVEERIADTGEDKWFFLVDYRNTRIDNDAWFAFGKRGKEVNLAHSMGTVRFDASEITRRQIERDAGTDKFDPNLFFDRDSAIERLRAMPSQRTAKIVHTPSFSADDINRRITFDTDQDIMSVDFSGMSFEHSRDVDDVYDILEQRLGATGQRWFFLVNYEGTRVQSPAWVQYAARGKRLNEQFALGSVRYAPGSETETDIRLRAESQGFRPNIRNTRAEALERIAEMKDEMRESADA